MKYCDKCDKSYDEEDKFCHTCGSKLFRQRKEKNDTLDRTTIKKTPKIYLILSIIVAATFIVLAYNYFLGSWFNFTPYLLFFITILWAIVNFVLIIYFIAKNYERISILIPIVSFLFIPILLLFEAPQLLYISLIAFIVEVLFSLLIIGSSLYLIWREIR